MNLVLEASRSLARCECEPYLQSHFFPLKHAFNINKLACKASFKIDNFRNKQIQTKKMHASC